MSAKKRPSPSPVAIAAASPESDRKAGQTLEDSPFYRGAFEQFVSAERELVLKIVAGVLDMKRTGAGINPWHLAQFLVELADAKTADLPKTVAQGLAALGISRRPRRGAPRGSGSKKYATWYEVFAGLYAPLWERKSELQQTQSRRWEERLQEELRQQRHDQQVIDALIHAQTQRQFITSLVADYFKVDYPSAERSIKRAGK